MEFFVVWVCSESIFSGSEGDQMRLTSLTWFDVGYDFYSGFVEEGNHPLEIGISGFIHVEHISVAIVSYCITGGELIEVVSA
jgi:hypothetical protein